MTKSLGTATAALWVAVLLSAAGAVYCKFRARQLFIQLEQSAWSTHAFVEIVAGKKLHMTMPAPKDIVIVPTVSAPGQ